MSREERKAFFRYRPGLLGNRRERGKRENNAQETSGFLRPGLVSVSDALVLGVLTLDLRITVISEKQKEVNPRKSDARLRVPMHHYPGRENSNIVYKRVGLNRGYVEQGDDPVP